MDEARLLLIPGPVSVEADVQEALGRPVPAHYGPAWTATYHRLQERLARLFGTEGRVFLLFGPGSAGIEMSFGSTLARGDEVVVASNGRFGERLITIAEGIGLTVHPVRVEGHRPLQRAAVEAALEAHPAARAFAVVHTETSTGVRNPVEELCPAAHERGVLTVVDAVASLGGLAIHMDEWGIDLCVSVVNKAVAAPVGVAPVAVAPRVWEAVDDGRPKAAGWYLNLATWRDYDEGWESWHPHPTTMPSNVVEALDVATARIERVGIEEYLARQARASGRVRQGLRELGFSLLTPDEDAAPVVTAARVPEAMDVADYETWLASEHGMHIGGGLGELEGRIFRVGHMGRAADPDVVDRYLRATADYLERAGLAPRAEAG
jgi:alanine-glyoxylate transaminase/serine-glyoxylate transaminase/serine-pyruvate transaminase